MMCLWTGTLNGRICRNAYVNSDLLISIAHKISGFNHNLLTEQNVTKDYLHDGTREKTTSKVHGLGEAEEAGDSLWSKLWILHSSEGNPRWRNIPALQTPPSHQILMKLYFWIHFQDLNSSGLLTSKIAWSDFVFFRLPMPILVTSWYLLPTDQILSLDILNFQATELLHKSNSLLYNVHSWHYWICLLREESTNEFCNFWFTFISD